MNDSNSSAEESDDHRSRKAELIKFTEVLLQAIQDADWETYVKLTDPMMTCFEPETVSVYVEDIFVLISYLEWTADQGTRFSSILF